MSLTTALGNAVRGIEVAQESVTNASHNIANANTPGYASQTINQQSLIVGGTGQGSEITGVSINVSQQLLTSLQEQVSALGSTATTSDYLEQAQRLYGSPNATNNLSTSIDTFFESLQQLSDNPQTVSLRLGAASAADSLADKISTIATGLEQLRFDADKEIESNITIINGLLNDLANTNTSITKFEEGSEGYTNIEQQRNLKLQQLSEYLDIGTITDENGQLSILTSTGLSLLDSDRYQLSYTPLASVENFINDLPLNALVIYPVDEDGNRRGTRQSELVSGGISSSVTSGFI